MGPPWGSGGAAGGPLALSRAAARLGYDRASEGGDPLKLSPAVRFLLWDYARGSVAYDLALLVVALIVLLVPGSFWGDPLWPR